MTVSAPHGVAAAALRAHWHAQIVAGPAAGLVAPLAGRRALGRADLADPAVSRTHVVVEATPRRVRVRDAGSRNGTYVRWGPTWRRLRRQRGWTTRGLLALGDSRIRLASRPLRPTITPPTPVRRWERTRLLAVAPLVFLPLVAGRLVPGWAGVLTAAVALVATVAAWWAWRRRVAPPLPAQVLLAAAVAPPPGSPASGHAAEAVGGWLGGSRVRRHGVLVDEGDRVCLLGPRSRAAARWLAAQVAVAGRARVREDSLVLRAHPDAGDLVLVAPDVETPPEARVLTWARSAADAPAWSTRLVPVPRAMPQTSPAWWTQVCALLGDGQGSGASELPRVVRLEGDPELLTGGPEITSAALAARWRTELEVSQPDHLRAFVGRERDGALVVDLVSEGPHALVAGTTGSGKSEALVTWLLGLACRYPPSQVGFVLVDYKGGETCAPLAGLPHVCGVVSDLEPQATRRALTSLSAELARRERVRAAGGQPGRRLVVVVDEFRRLAEEEPRTLATLLRIATIGRSLGVHVILATQRPAGIVDQQMRANLPLRLSLRVLEPADSHDVLGHADAARLPAIPGRGILAGRGPLQVAWAGEESDVTRLVATLAEAWRSVGGTRAPAPWAPPLPDQLAWTDRLKWADTEERPVVGWVDDPDHQRLGAATVPATLAALVVGGPGSGRTSAARALARALGERGQPCHVIGREGEPWPEAASLVATTDVAAAWDLLAAAAGRDGVVVIDGADDLLAESDRALGVGVMSNHLASLVRRAGPHTPIVVTGSPTLASARWSQGLRQRVILPCQGLLDAAHLGLAPAECRAADRPGRALWVDGTTQRLMHFAQPTRAPLAPAPALVSPLPRQGRHPDATVIGWCSPDGRQLRADAHRLWLVVAAEGPWRTAALTLLHRGLDACGRRVVTLGDETIHTLPPLKEDEHLVCATTPAHLRRAYTGALVELQERAGIVARGSDAEVGPVLPPGAHHLVAIDLTVAGRGLYIGGGVAHQIQLCDAQM